FGLRRACHDRVVAVADDDVADADGNADAPCPLDLRAADLDGVTVADVFLDRRREPRRRHVEIDRTCAEAPPQAAETTGEDDAERTDDDGKPPHPALAGEPPLHR